MAAGLPAEGAKEPMARSGGESAGEVMWVVAKDALRAWGNWERKAAAAAAGL